MLSASGRTLCPTCGAQFVQEHGGSNRLSRQVDPTVCVNCGADNGDTPHATLMKLPTCAKCTDFYRNRPFPGWVKASFAAVMALVLVSLAWNWRFFQAHFEIKAAIVALSKDNFQAASQNALAAAAHAPEVPFFQSLAAYCQGVSFLQNGKSEKAEECLQRCGDLPKSLHAPLLLEQASLGAAFDRKDYDRFLQLAEERARQHPQDSIAQAQVASALACQYAAHGDGDLRRRAEAKLEEAKRIDSKPLQAARYDERILHRLQTREIISGEEFLRRFPHGWTPSGAPGS